MTIYLTIYCPPCRVDVIFLSGDVADMPMAYGSDTSDEAVLFKGSYLEDYKTVVEMISTISDNIYSIPGNVSTTHTHTPYILLVCNRTTCL